MSAFVCLSTKGGRSDGAASLSALASGSLAAWAVCSARERERLRGKATRGGRRGVRIGRIWRGKRQKNKTKLKEMRGNFPRRAES